MVASLEHLDSSFSAVAINMLRVTFDPAKNARNMTERSLSFERVADLDWETAVAVEDDRKDYGERRLRVMALLGPRLHVAVITYRGEAMHVISFREGEFEVTPNLVATILAPHAEERCE
jgi:uncharacterized DUF497 family protein